MANPGYRGLTMLSGLPEDSHFFGPNHGNGPQSACGPSTRPRERLLWPCRGLPEAWVSGKVEAQRHPFEWRVTKFPGTCKAIKLGREDLELFSHSLRTQSYALSSALRETELETLSFVSLGLVKCTWISLG